MLSDLSIDDISTLLTKGFDFTVALANVLLLILALRTFLLQIKSNYSLNHQALVNGHRELFLGLLHRPDVLNKFAIANKIDTDTWELKIISAFFINQVFAHYLNLTNGTIEQSYLEGLKQDAREVFSFPTVRKHWQHSRDAYAQEFQEFVEELLPPSTGASDSDDESSSKSLRPEGLGEPSPLR
ncbi:MAG: hypothetical protein AAF959_00670 [Cyanobacteria bacterium P01_D01_bin.56]